MTIDIVDPQTADNPTATQEPAAPAPPAPAQDWHATLPDDLRVHKSLEKFQGKGVGDLFRSYVNLESAYGKKLDGMVKVPGEQSTPEEVAAFHKAMGVPENVAEFKVDVPQDLRQLVPEETVNAFVPIFHKLGVPPQAAQQIVQAYGEHAQRVIADKEKEYAAGRDALRREWGDATWTRRNALAERAITEMVSEELTELIKHSGTAGHPEWVKYFAKLGEDMAEDGLIDGRLTAGEPSAEALEARKKEIEQDADFLSDRNPAKHAALVQEWNKILAQLNPTPIR